MTYSVGYVILAHEHLRRVKQLANYLTTTNCPVVIHIDQRTPRTEFNELATALNSNPLVRFTPRRKTEWGCIELVNASLDSVGVMLAEFPKVGHVMLSSGSCLPCKSAQELSDFLSTRQGTDFIESVSVENEEWVQDGLSVERFKMFFPFSWKTQRRLFECTTWIQRKLRINRRRPDNLIPHLGSQWWCLTRETLAKIMNDPRRSAYDRYFSKTWIPDESYFQTLARKHSDRLESRSLTWSKFDADGKPFLLYDDHLDVVGKSTCFMVRKVWPKANKLYQTLLDIDYQAPVVALSAEDTTTNFFNNAHSVRRPERSGKVNPGRFPTGQFAKFDKTARKYTVLMGPRLVFPELQSWISQNTKTLCHGNLFAKDGVDFAEEADTFDGKISNNRLIRNYRASAFLANVIWNRRDVEHAFFFDIGDNQKAHDAIFKDANAHVILIKEAWILHYLKLQKAGADTRSKAKLLHASEQRLNRVIARASTEAYLTVFSLQDIFQNPTVLLRKIQETVSDETVSLVSTPTQEVGLDQLNAVILHLRNEGFKLETDIISSSIGPHGDTGQKPRLVDG
ncbi:MAG TPA: glycosyl transferase [Rhodobacteraceae bacterium]|nr:glycosyl transferase [Paracoccaceae bacterium]